MAKLFFNNFHEETSPLVRESPVLVYKLTDWLLDGPKEDFKLLMKFRYGLVLSRILTCSDNIFL